MDSSRDDEETQMLKRTLKQMFGENVEMTPAMLEDAREIYRIRMADTALNEGDA